MMLKAKVIVKGNCMICGKPIDNDNVFFCKVCERGNYMSKLDNPISEKKMQIVINNYFKAECDVNTSIREAFEKGFRIGVQKGQCIKHAPSARPEVIKCKECKHHHYDHDIPYCDRIDYGYGWEDNDFCSRAERRTDEQV